MIPNVQIDFDEIRQFNRELKALGLARGLQPTNKKAAEAAVPPVRRRAVGTWPNLAGGVSRLGSRGVASIRANATQTKAYIVAGGARVPYFGGVNWGSAGRYRQFGPRTDMGRVLHPGIIDAMPQVVETYVRDLDGLLRGPFPQGRL